MHKHERHTAYRIATVTSSDKKLRTRTAKMKKLSCEGHKAPAVKAEGVSRRSSWRQKARRCSFFSHFSGLAAAFCFLAVSSLCVAAQPFFADGKTEWKIFVAPDADPAVAYAAEELQTALKKISGADFEVVTGAEPTGKAIIIGDLSNPEVNAHAARMKLDEKAGVVESVAVFTDKNRLYLASNQPRGALYAVYSFLQDHLGVRWLWPGKDGEFMPKKASWNLPDLAYHHTPSFAYRGFHLTGDRKAPGQAAEFLQWEARNRLNYYMHTASPKEKRMGFYSVMGGHGIRLPADLLKTHPEYFAEIDGRRTADQICYSNPEALRLIIEKFTEQIRKVPHLDIFGVIPGDTPRSCRCAECAKMDPSTAWFSFYNRLTDALKKEFPHLKFTGMAYSFYRGVPKIEIRNCEFLNYASYDRCTIHPFGTPGCKDNETTLESLEEWKAAGVPIGDYTYEHGVFRTTSLSSERQVRFLPFLSMFADMIKTYHKLGHVAIVPERHIIGFLPKYETLVPTEDYLYQDQHRLTSYIFGRLMWDADLPLEDIVRDWCETVFGTAAQPMFDYYMAMDKAWGNMPTHYRFLGHAHPYAPMLLAGDLPERAKGFFAAAEKLLPEIQDPEARQRVAREITRARIYFKQWENLVCLNDTENPLRINVPMRSPENGYGEVFSKMRSFGETTRTEVGVAWSKEDLIVKWENQELRGGADSVELILSDGVSENWWHLSVDSEGAKKSWLEKQDGSRDENWNPDWQAHTGRDGKGWTATMTIPFAKLGIPAVPTESWKANFVRHHSGGKDTYPVGKPAVLFLNRAARADQVVLWWLGAKDDKNEEIGYRWHKNEFSNVSAFELRMVAEPGELVERSQGATAFWFQNPGGPKHIPDEYWSKTLVPAVKNGAVAVFSATKDPGVPFPLETYLNDPSFRVSVRPMDSKHRSADTIKTITEGDWALKPNNLIEGEDWPPLKMRRTPAIGFLPEDPKAWTTLLAMPVDNEETEYVPYVLIRPYGKGLIVVNAVSDSLQRAKLLDNLIWFNKQRTQGE